MIIISFFIKYILILFAIFIMTGFFFIKVLLLIFIISFFYLLQNKIFNYMFDTIFIEIYNLEIVNSIIYCFFEIINLLFNFL